MLSSNNNPFGSDILSERGKVQSIWDSLVESQDVNDQKTQFILSELKDKILNHLYLDDVECMSAIQSLHRLTYRISKSDIVPSSYVQFLYYMTDSLSEYISINSEFTNNNNFNTFDNASKLSTKDESILISEMYRSGLIDSTKVQSLLDNQNLEMMTTANGLITKCSQVKSPSQESGSRSIPKHRFVTLDDFGTDVEKILDCVNKLITTNVDSFPESIEDVRNLILPIDMFSCRVLYSQGTYVSNLASYDILFGTSKYLKGTSRMDLDTAVYVLSNAMDKVMDLMKECNQAICLISYMVLGAIAIRYLNELEENEVLNNLMRTRLANAYTLYNNLCKTESSKEQPMIQLPESLREFLSTVEREDDVDLSDTSELEDALDGILSSIETLGTELELQKSKLVISESKGTSTLSSPLSESMGFEQVEQLGVLESKLSDFAWNIHNELNCSLLESNYERAATNLALEIALIEQLTDNQQTLSQVHIASMESVKRDIATYRPMFEHGNAIEPHMKYAYWRLGRLLDGVEELNQ